MFLVHLVTHMNSIVNVMQPVNRHARIAHLRCVPLVFRDMYVISDTCGTPPQANVSYPHSVARNLIVNHTT